MEEKSNLTYQRDRIYSLIVGDDEKAFFINNLQMKFNVTKNSDNSEDKNRAVVEIYNLSESTRKALEKDYIQVRLDVGYARIGLVTLFTGQVVSISNSKIKPFLSVRSGQDIVTKLEIDEMHTPLNHSIQSKIVPEGAVVKDAILELIKDIPEITHNEMNGEGIKKRLHDGFPIHGSPRAVLNRVAKAYNLEWQIDNGVLMVADKYKSYMRNTDKVPMIGQMSGLIEAPEFVSSGGRRGIASTNSQNNVKGDAAKDSLKLKVLLNPTLVAGSYFKLEYKDLTGYYKIDEVTFRGDYRGDDWYSELTCSERVD